MLETKRTTSVEELQQQMKLEQAVLRACKPLDKRIALLEERLAAAEKEWKANPHRYRKALADEEFNRLNSARFAVSEHGVKFALQGDGLDDWRRRFLGSQREKAIRAKYEVTRESRLGPIS